MPPSDRQTALVVGATRGIGFALACAYAADDWDVLATFRSAEGARRLRSVPGRVEVHRLELAQDGDLTRLARTLAGRRVDVVVLAAGAFVSHQEDAATLEPALWLHSFRVNAIGPVRLAALLVPNLRRAPAPRIVALGSTLGSLALAQGGGVYAYRSSKAALHAAMRSLAADLRADGIVATTIDPGHVRTDLTGADRTGADQAGTDVARTPEEAAADIRGVVSRLSPEDSGRFLDCAGAPVPW